MATETLTGGALPRVQWSAVIAGALCAIAAHIVLGLFGAAFGLAAEPGDSAGIGVAAGLWGLAVPFAASLIGAWIAVRLARETDQGGAVMHGVLPWAIGLIAGALFLTGSVASGAMSSATAASGNLRGESRQQARASARSEQAQDDAAKAAAAAAGAGGLGALLGLCGAVAGATLGRQALTGRGLRRMRGREDERYAREYREEFGTTGVAHADRSGVVTTTTRPPEHRGQVPPGDDPLHH